MKKQNVLEEAKRVLEIEAQAILDLKNKINKNFVEAVNKISSCQGKLIVIGIGKSGHVGRKIASTFASTGTPSVFLHPAESIHGDLGIITKTDMILAISYGGENLEFSEILKFITRKEIPLIAITGNPQSTLGKAAEICLDIHVEKEACPLGLAPTASSTATLALGDALAMSVLNAKGFSPEEFAENHPGGKLGKKLLTRVKDLMHSGEALPLVKENTEMKKVVSIMTSGNVRGVAGVINDKGTLVGIITDGDLRRRLEKSQNPLNGVAKDIMNPNPKTINGDELAEKAFFMMEKYSIQMLFVIEDAEASSTKPIGVIHFHDLLRANIR